MLRLQRVEGNCYDLSLQPEKILLKPTVTRLGRSDEYSDVVIDSVISPLMISRVHAEIHFSNGEFRIDCKGLNGLLVNKKNRSSAVLCDGDVVVFGGAGVKTKEGQSLSAYDSELVYVFNEVCQNDSEEVGSLGEGTSDGSVRRRSKRKKPASLSEGVSSPCEKKTKGSMDDKQVFKVDQKADPQEEVNISEVDESRSKKCLKDLNEELLCCICRELIVLAHTLPCSHTFCFGCIRDWLCHSKDCPNCRAKAQLKSAVPVKVLDNTINKVAEEVLSPEELEERQLKIQEMSKEAKKKNGKKVLPVSSTSDSESEDDESESVQESNDSDDYSEEESDYNDYSYGVEHARSGRALCRTCGSLIPNRSLRWVVAFNTRLGYRQYRQKYYHHLECYLPPDHVTFERLSISSDLSRADRRLVTTRLRER